MTWEGRLFSMHRPLANPQTLLPEVGTRATVCLALDLSVAQAYSQPWEGGCFRKCHGTLPRIGMELVPVSDSALYWASWHCRTAEASVVGCLALSIPRCWLV